MRFFILVSMVFTIAIVSLAACNSHETLISQAPKSAAQTPQRQPPPPPPDNARRITAEEAHDLWKKGKALIVDTRTEPAFKESRIKSAILIPEGEILKKIDELPRDKTIITYCT